MAILKARPEWRGTGNDDNAINFYQLNLGFKSHAGVILGGGTSADPVTTATADKKWMSFYLENSATSGDSRALYLRFYLSGAGGGGEAARIFTTVNDVAVGTAHGAHISLNFADSGSVTGQGIAGRNTLHIPDASLGGGNVKYSALQAEIWSDGASSDPNGNYLSCIRCLNAGNGTGMAVVDDDCALFDIEGFVDATGNMLYGSTLRIRINNVDKYLFFSDAEGSFETTSSFSLTGTIGLSITGVTATTNALIIGADGVSSGDFIIYGEAASSYMQYDSTMTGDNKGRFIVAESSARFTCPSTKNTCAVAITHTVDQAYSDTSGAHGLWSTCSLGAYNLTSTSYTHYAGVHGDAVIGATLSGVGVHVYGVLGEIRGTGTQTTANVIAAVAAKYNNATELGTGDSCLYWGWSHAGVVDYGLKLEVSGSGSLTTGIDIGACATGISMSGAMTTGILISGVCSGVSVQITNGTLTAGDSSSGIRVGVASADPSNSYGAAAYFNTVVSGTQAGSYVYGIGSWINLSAVTAVAGRYICAQDNGIYQGADDGEVNGAKLIFGIRMECLLASSDAETYPFSLNTSDTAITAIFESSGTELGLVVDAGNDEGELVPLLSRGGNTRYVKLYTLA